MQKDDGQDEDDDNGGSGKQHDEKEAGVVGRFLFQVSELLLQIVGKLLQVAGKLLGMVILVFHIVLDAAAGGKRTGIGSVFRASLECT